MVVFFLRGKVWLKGMVFGLINENGDMIGYNYWKIVDGILCE